MHLLSLAPNQPGYSQCQTLIISTYPRCPYTRASGVICIKKMTLPVCHQFELGVIHGSYRSHGILRGRWIPPTGVLPVLSPVVTPILSLPFDRWTGKEDHPGGEFLRRMANTSTDSVNTTTMAGDGLNAVEVVDQAMDEGPTDSTGITAILYAAGAWGHRHCPVVPFSLCSSPHRSIGWHGLMVWCLSSLSVPGEQGSKGNVDQGLREPGRRRCVCQASSNGIG